jgi:hypothetical protein
MTFVNLDRRFLPWNEKDGTAADLYAIHGFERDSRCWQELLKSRRVVILAEAGSGKTEELKAQADLLQSKGQYSFYMRVQDVARDGIDGSLGILDRQQLDGWRASDKKAWLFVDSVDEARLNGLRLETALRKLANGIHPAAARAHVFISGRVTDWEFCADLKRLSEVLPVPPDHPRRPPLSPETILGQVIRGEYRRPDENAAAAEQPIVVVMAALNEARVRAYASANGVTHPEAFISAIQEANLWSLARRPLDLNWLVAYWRRHARLGTLSAMMELSLAERLQEPDPQRARTDPIEHSRAMRALERVGASLVFGRFDTLTIPDPETASGTQTSELDLILPDWSSEHRRRLLARAVFDPATFGRVRLHNDNQGAVRSFLTANWLLRRRQENCSVRDLLDLVFAESYGYSVVKPSLQETVAWLAIRDTDVAREVLARLPALLLTAGDPASLAAPLRERTLARVVDEICRSGRGLGILDEDALRRFATSDLGQQIGAIWTQHKGIEPVRVLLLRMIWLGRINACANIAAEVIFGSYHDQHTLIFAGRALVATSDAATIDRYARQVAANASKTDGRVLSEALDQLFMHTHGLGVEEFLTILRETGVAVRQDTLGIRYFRSNFISRVTARDDLECLLTGLIQLVGPPPRNYATSETALETAYLPSIAAAAHALMKTVGRAEAAESAMSAALRLNAERRMRGIDVELGGLLGEFALSPQRRRLLFWHAAATLADTRKLQGQPLDRASLMQILGWPANLTPEDVAWLLADVPGRTDPVQRRLAIDAALDIWRRNNRPNDMLEQIRAVADADPDTAVVLRAWITPPVVSPEEADARRQIALIEARQAEELSVAQRAWNDFLEPLRADPGILRRIPPPTGERVDVRLFNLCELWRSLTEYQSRYAIDDLRPLESVLGQDLTEAFRDALVAFWRHWTPTLESNRAPDNRNQVSKIDCMALAAISLEARATPDWLGRLNSGDASKAAAFATLELNGFPPWFPKLAAAWPKEVAAVLLHEIISQLDDTTPGPRRGTLQDVAHSVHTSTEQGIARIVAPALLAQLEKRISLSDPPLSDVLFILGSTILSSDTSFSKLLLDRARSSDDLDRAALYLGGAFQRDASEALNLLNLRLGELGPAQQRELLERLLPRIFGDIFHELVQTPALPIGVLEALTRIAFRTVRVEDDNPREGGRVSTSNIRDAAERARSTLFGQLIATPGRATIEALRRLKADQDIPILPHIFDERCLSRAEADSEHSPWEPDEAFELEQKFDTAPNTPLDLQRVAMRRLADIGHDLHHADFAQGAVVKALKGERAVQNWIANELRTRQRRAYSVEREPHVVEEKEPDIRLRAQTTDASLPIEIKVAESWSLSELEDALNIQLGGRYLRHQDGKHGVLLLVHQKRRGSRGWESAAGSSLSFREVVSHLATLADENAAKGADAPQAVIAVLDVSDIAAPKRRSRKHNARSRRQKRKRGRRPA